MGIQLLRLKCFTMPNTNRQLKRDGEVFPLIVRDSSMVVRLGGGKGRRKAGAEKIVMVPLMTVRPQDHFSSSPPRYFQRRKPVIIKRNSMPLAQRDYLRIEAMDGNMDTWGPLHIDSLDVSTCDFPTSVVTILSVWL